jgi:hypothetical protein
VTEQEFEFQLRNWPFLVQVLGISLAIVFIFSLAVEVNIYFLPLIPIVSVIAAATLFKNKKVILTDQAIKAFDMLGNPHQMQWENIDQIKSFGMTSCCQYLQFINKEERTLWIPTFFQNKDRFILKN